MNSQSNEFLVNIGKILIVPPSFFIWLGEKNSQLESLGSEAMRFLILRVTDKYPELPSKLNGTTRLAVFSVSVLECFFVEVYHPETGQILWIRFENESAKNTQLIG